MEHQIEIIGAYDFRGSTAGRYGQHGCVIQAAVIGNKGAISLTIFTDWYIDQSQENRRILQERMPWVADVGYHSRESREYASHNEKCHLLDGPCWYDGTSLNEKWTEGILHGGTKWMWEKMEDLYRHFYEGGPWPDLTPTPREEPKVRAS